jgi:predicted transcriptional regulator
MAIQSVRIPEDLESKINEINAQTKQSKHSIILDALRIGLDCPKEPELSDRVANLETRVTNIEARLDG